MSSIRWVALVVLVLIGCSGAEEPTTSSSIVPPAAPSSESSFVPNSFEAAGDQAPSGKASGPRLTDAGAYRVDLRPRSGRASVGPLHEWVLRVEDADGSAFVARRIAVGGGMPQHSHGFVTAPRVTRPLSSGVYLVEGVKFHMGGDWIMRVDLVGDAGADVAIFEVHVGP